MGDAAFLNCQVASKRCNFALIFKSTEFYGGGL
jgi:hypothetical protein